MIEDVHPALHQHLSQMSPWKLLDIWRPMRAKSLERKSMDTSPLPSSSQWRCGPCAASVAMMSCFNAALLLKENGHFSNLLGQLREYHRFPLDPCTCAPPRWSRQGKSFRSRANGPATTRASCSGSFVRCGVILVLWFLPGCRQVIVHGR